MRLNKELACYAEEIVGIASLRPADLVRSKLTTSRIRNTPRCGDAPVHYMGFFAYDWMSHLGSIYLGAIIYVLGVVLALIGLSQAAPEAAQARR